MNNKKTFVSSVKMDNSRTQLTNVEVKYHKSGAFVKSNVSGSKPLAKNIRSASSREQYRIVKE